jgi:hypothetical protein
MIKLPPRNLKELVKQMGWYQNCPNCEKDSIGNHQVQKTALCLKCRKYWNLRRNPASCKVFWQYLKDEYVNKEFISK